MRKFYSEAFEAIYEDVLADFELGIITEAELKEFEAEAFIDEDTDEFSETLPKKPHIMNSLPR